MLDALVRKIDDRSAEIAVIGLGYVGLPLAVEFVKSGFSVTGFDIDKNKVRSLERGEGYIKHIDITTLVSNKDKNGGGQGKTTKGSFRAKSTFSLIKKADCIIICVPTPLNVHREPDLSFVMNTVRVIARHLKEGQLIVLESTTYPGTTDGDVKVGLEKTGLRAGKEFFLAFSPEREDPNNKNYPMKEIPKVVGGYTNKCLAAAKALYETVVKRTVPVSSTATAEASKLLENIYRATNIALVNELKVLFDKMGIDIWEVIEAAKTKPFGFQPFYPGPGLGGHCIPIDPFYLAWKAREFGLSMRFIELAGEINTSMPDYVLSKALLALNNAKKNIKEAKILLLGFSYKENIGDDRESPAYPLMEKLENAGARVSYNDPHISVIGPTRRFTKFAGRRSVEISGDYDLMIVLTAHDEYKNLDLTKFHIPLVDTRNLIKERNGFVYKA